MHYETFEFLDITAGPQMSSPMLRSGQLLYGQRPTTLQIQRTWSTFVRNLRPSSVVNFANSLASHVVLVLGQHANMKPGKVVILNGPSSSGKTTVSLATRDLHGPACSVVSIDQFYQSVNPARDNNWELFYTLTQVLLDSASSFAKHGFDVVVDTVFERRDCFEACLQSFTGVETRLVGLTAPLEILSARERRRGNRRPGLAREQSVRVHEGFVYDLMLDTSELPVDECAAEILRLFGRSPCTTVTKKGKGAPD